MPDLTRCITKAMNELQQKASFYKISYNDSALMIIALVEIETKWTFCSEKAKTEI